MTKKILIVEDEVIIAMEYRMDLAMSGYMDVSIVSTASEAINRADRDKPDLIIMDIKLKGDFSGIYAATQIRKKSNVPILFITGTSDANVVEQVKALKYSIILLKPTRTKDMLVEIKKIFNLSNF